MFESEIAIAMDWKDNWIGIAVRYPIALYSGLLILFISLMMSRNFIIFASSVFITVVAVYALEPINEIMMRQIFAYGLYGVIFAISLAAMNLRLRLREARDRLRSAEADVDELRRLYDREVYWRKASGDNREKLPSATSTNFNK